MKLGNGNNNFACRLTKQHNIVNVEVRRNNLRIISLALDIPYK